MKALIRAGRLTNLTVFTLDCNYIVRNIQVYCTTTSDEYSTVKTTAFIIAKLICFRSTSFQTKARPEQTLTNTSVTAKHCYEIKCHSKRIVVKFYRDTVLGLS